MTTEPPFDSRRDEGHREDVAPSAPTSAYESEGNTEAPDPVAHLRFMAEQCRIDAQHHRRSFHEYRSRADAAAAFATRCAREAAAFDAAADRLDDVREGTS
jgi:hypothetical protein